MFTSPSMAVRFELISLVKKRKKGLRGEEKKLWE